MRLLACSVGLSMLVACAQSSGTSSPPVTLPEGRGAPARLDPGNRQQIYAVNNMGNSVTEYLANASGNVSPGATIAGSNTQLNAPINIALDGSGAIYVTNLNANAVTVYPPGSNGNVAPSATITCGGLNLPDGAAVDASGNLYVANLQGNTISIFSSGANGCVSNPGHIGGRRTKLSRPTALMISG